MLEWVGMLPESKKRKITAFIRRLETAEESAEEIPATLGSGQFADCYEVAGVVVKRTHNECIDDNWDENLRFELSFTIDHYVLSDLQHLACVPRLYAYTEGEAKGAYTVMEKAKGETLESMLLRGMSITSEIDEAIVESFAGMIEAGYYPWDVQLDDIFFDEGKVMFIDFNIYQEMGCLQLEGASLDFTKSSHELAKGVWKDLRNSGLRWIYKRQELAASTKNVVAAWGRN